MGGRPTSSAEARLTVAVGTARACPDRRAVRARTSLLFIVAVLKVCLVQSIVELDSQEGTV